MKVCSVLDVQQHLQVCTMHWCVQSALVVQGFLGCAKHVLWVCTVPAGVHGALGCAECMR